MKLSYAITVCNEFIEIQKLLGFLLKNKRVEDEIVVLFDETNGDLEVENFLRSYSAKVGFSWHKAKFQGHFADWKNHLTKLCTGDYIFQIDADEMVTEYICQILPQILEANQVDVIRVPRINTVKGLTEQHVQRWGWQVNEKGHVNFPDYQWRIYRKADHIKWENKVHEVLTGYETISHLPLDTEFCLIHEKTIERQERQNEYYNTL